MSDIYIYNVGLISSMAYACMYFLAAFVLLCVDVMVMSSAYAKT